MSDVAARIKVMPESPEVDLDALEERLRDALPEGAEIGRASCRERVSSPV